MNIAASLVMALMAAQLVSQSGNEGPMVINAEDFSGSQDEGRLLYTGDVNVVRGDTRLRADRVEALFERVEGGWARSPNQIIATGEVYYVTLSGVARGDDGVYDLETGTIEMTGSVVLTQGCNVSTGNQLVVNLDDGRVRLTGGGDGADQRVRSVFFEDDEAEPGPVAPEDCPQPQVPGQGPQPFDDDVER